MRGRVTRSVAWLAIGMCVSAPQVVLSADCNTNGVDDLQDIAMGGSADCNSNDIPDSCDLVRPSFSPAIPVSVAGPPRAMVLGDFDNDGLLEAAVGVDPSGESVTAMVSVLLNRADGAFESVDQQSGERITAMAAGDLDGDGDLDVVSKEFEKVQVLLNNGDGSLAPPLTVDTGLVSSLDIGDVDGDQSMDLVVTSTVRPYNVSVFLSNGDGSFGEPLATPIGDRPVAVSLEDLNGDGDLDITTANSSSKDLSILLNAGDGSFGPARSIDLMARTAEKLVVADLTGDGNPDLAVSTRSSGVVIIHNEGQGNFAEKRSIALPSRLIAFASGDVDGDGDLDLVGALRVATDVTLFVNQGDGTFNAQLDLEFEVEASRAQSCLEDP